MNSQPFVIERTFHVPIAKVWEAITNKDQMKQWYFDLPDFKPQVGCKFSFIGGPEDGIQYVHLCEVTEVVAGKKITYSWRYEGYPGNSFVTFELTEDGSKTKLKLTHEGLETFPADNPDFAPKNFAEGWTDFMNKALKDFLKD